MLLTGPVPVSVPFLFPRFCLRFCSSGRWLNIEQLRSLLPGVESDQAITVNETISEKAEDRPSVSQAAKEKDFDLGFGPIRYRGWLRGLKWLRR